MRILKKHGTGIPDAGLACLVELKGKLCLSLKILKVACIQPPALEDKVVALIREEFGAVVRASRISPWLTKQSFFPPTWAYIKAQFPIFADKLTHPILPIF